MKGISLSIIKNFLRISDTGDNIQSKKIIVLVLGQKFSIMLPYNNHLTHCNLKVLKTERRTSNIALKYR